jgi:hypothetical protein
MDPLLIVIILALLATVATMFLGLLSMSGGGPTDRWLSTPLMWVRIGFQGLAVLLMITAIILR